MCDLFNDMKHSFEEALEIEKSLSEEVRDENFFKVMDEGIPAAQEDKALKLMYGENLTNHELSDKLKIPLASATRTTCGMRKLGYLFNIEKVYVNGRPRAMMGLTKLGKKVGLSLLWRDLHNKKVGE